VTPRGDAEIGSVIAGHRIEALVARGGMGVVYRVTHLSLQTERALKLIAPELAADQDFRSRFKREWRIAASIEHPHAIPIHDAGEADGQLYIAMRYVQGTDLRQLIARDGALEPDMAATVVAQVASALDAAHERGLVHRDIKPANILIAADTGAPHAFLTDFGLSKHAGSTVQLTGTGHWLGTVDYVAPEQAEGKPVDARTDIYGLGCVLFQALTGEIPYPRDNDVAKIWAHVNDPPPSLARRKPQLPDALDGVVQRAMAKDPERRYLSAGDFGRAAVAAAQGRSYTRPERSVARGEAAAGVVPVNDATRRQRHGDARRSWPAELRRRYRPYATAGLALALLLVVAAIAGLLSKQEDTVVSPTQRTLVEYQDQVGQICGDVNQVNRRAARRAGGYGRRVRAAKDLQQVRDLIVGETQQRISSSNTLSSRLAGLNPPSRRLAARQLATVRHFRRNTSRFQAYRDRLKGVRTYPELRQVVTRFDSGQRTPIERTAAQTHAGLQGLGGSACELEVPPVPKPVSLPADPTRKDQSDADAGLPSQGADNPSTPGGSSGTGPGTNPPSPDTNPPSPDAAPPSPAAPDATPPPAAGEG
jgi:hypothetical protein